MANKRHSWIIFINPKDVDNINFNTDECMKCGALRMKRRDEETGKPDYRYFDSQADFDINWGYRSYAGECK